MVRLAWSEAQCHSGWNWTPKAKALASRTRTASTVPVFGHGLDLEAVGDAVKGLFVQRVDHHLVGADQDGELAGELDGVLEAEQVIEFALSGAVVGAAADVMDLLVQCAAHWRR